MAAAYIIRKNDTYYFRQCLSQSARNRFNKYEFSKSLRVNRKKDAIVLSRELKIAFDQIFNKAMRKHSVTWQQIRDAVNEAFEIIFKNFVKSANDYGPTYNDSYDSLKFIPPEYEQFLVVGDTTVNWKSIADIASLSERIANWKEIEIKKDSDEFNLLCYTVADSLKRHDYNKELFRKNPDIYSCQPQNVENQVDCKEKNKINYVKEVFERYWEENVNGWSVASIRNYSGVYKSLFEILATTAGISFEEIEFSHLDNDLIDEFFFNLMHLPAQFSKRFTGKMTMGQVLEYSKRLKKGEDVAGLDEPTKKNLMDTTSANTLNGKYIIKMNNFLDHAVATGKMEKNWLSGREIKSKEVVVKRRVFSKEELKVIFSEKMFTEKICYKNEYSRFWLPILSLYTGARINEVAQLRACDFKKENDIYYINITESEYTSVKTKSSIRKIPLHPDLVKIGFVKYCEWMRNKNEMFLFPELHGLDQLKPGEKASRAFSTFFKTLGIAKETEDGKATFHSFRHTFADFLIQNYLYNTHKCALMGHSFSNTTDKQYGDGVSLQTKYEDIVKCIDLKNHSFPWNNEDYFKINRFQWEI